MDDVISRQAPIMLLPSAQPEHFREVTKKMDVVSRQATCEYCHEDFEGYVKPIEKNGHAFVRFGMNGWCLELHAKGWHGETKINYCPMCGRSLTHE